MYCITYTLNKICYFEEKHTFLHQISLATHDFINQNNLKCYKTFLLFESMHFMTPSCDLANYMYPVKLEITVLRTSKQQEQNKMTQVANLIDLCSKFVLSVS